MPDIKANTDLNILESSQLAGLVRAEVKQCYRNAVMALLQDADLEAAGAVYVEGVYVTHLGIPLDHAWIETPAGEVLDPTIVLHLEQGEVIRYYAGIRYSHAEVMQLAVKERRSMPFYGVYSPAVVMAHQAALLDSLLPTGAGEDARDRLASALNALWKPGKQE